MSNYSSYTSEGIDTNDELIAIYQQKVYGNDKLMMNRSKLTSLYDFINGKLGKNYNNIQLLNDYHHLLYEHDAEGQFEQIYNYLITQIGSKCILSLCTSLSAETEDCKDENIKEMETRQCIKQIHCYLMHSFDLGMKLQNSELQKISMYKHDIDDNDTFSLNPIDERLRVISKIITGKNQKNSAIFRKYLNRNYNKYESEGINGTKYYYWNWYKNKGNLDIFNGGLVSDWFVTKRYKDLKTEMLQNRYSKDAKLSKQSFDCLVEKTKHLMGCDKTKNIRFVLYIYFFYVSIHCIP